MHYNNHTTINNLELNTLKTVEMTVDFIDTHLSISVNLWCKMHYNHQNTTHAAVTLTHVFSEYNDLKKH